MEGLPDEVFDVIKKFTIENRDDIDRAVALSDAEILEMPEFDDSVNATLRQVGIRAIVHGLRHHSNSAFRKTGSGYMGPAKTTVGCAAVDRAISQMFLKVYCIGGRTLGSLLGKELPSIRDKEHSTGMGHLLNAKILTAIIPLMTDGEKRVDECLSEEQAVEIHQLAKGEDGKAAAHTNNGANGKAIAVLKPSQSVPNHSRNGRTKEKLSPTSEVSGRETKAAVKAKAKAKSPSVAAKKK